jgi:hypothetical protein
VYCAQGNTYQRREQLKIPEGTLPKRRRGLPWGKIFLAILVLAGIAVYFHPEYNEKIHAFLRSLTSSASSQ